MKIAERIGKPLRWVRKHISRREFLLWRLKFEKEWNEEDKLSCYLAQIAAEVRMGRTGKGASIDDLFVKFKQTEPDKQLTSQEVLERKKQNSATSRAAWMGFGAATKKKKLPPKVLAKQKAKQQQKGLGNGQRVNRTGKAGRKAGG